MYEYAKYEFGRWLSEQKTDELSPYQKQLIGILIKHFDEIAAVGTANGGRAKVLGKYILALETSVEGDVDLNMDSRVTTRRIKRIASMNVEKFRGFGTPVSFSFDKQYTLFHGTNGSGKTSFCEALEYSMLGTIEEASARNIPVDKYILHAGQRKPVYPILRCDFTDGTSGDCISDLAAYRFAFIEKNRIEAFSHMGATTAKNQTERIAALFGLSEFQEYVSGFTASLDNRYLKIESDSQDKYEKKIDVIEERQSQIEETRKQIEPTRIALSEAIKALNVPSIKDVSEAKDYLSNPETGQIAVLMKEANENKRPIINENTVNCLIEEIQKIISSKSNIDREASIILGNVESVNLLALYNSLIDLQSTWKEEICPACHTPLVRVEKNPFEHAKESISSFSKIEEAKGEIATESKKAVASFQVIQRLAKDLPLQLIFPTANLMTLSDSSITREDFETLNSNAINTYNLLCSLKDLLCEDNAVEKIRAYNNTAIENNNKYDSEIKRLQALHTTIVETSAAVEAIDNNIKALNETLEKDEEALKKLKETAENDARIIEFNKKMVDAYDAVVQSLKNFAENLPLEMATNLADKVVVYYNEMNNGDAEFELLESIKLPVSQNDKIIVTMRDGTEQDAMLLLSDGHVRILGLSILLAKAVQMKMPFIIFDDVVNAIDDDHRDGVAKLLIEHPDFVDVQMILTCHGEIFVSKLEELVRKKNAVERYIFLPADSLNERGIVIRYQDPSLPLATARAKYEEGALKDCAAKCRQAVECITGHLWNKMAPNINGGIKVKLRTLKASPDLYQITTALKSASKPKYFVGMEEVNADLEKLVETRMWTLLNKGTHVDESIPEFTRIEVRELLELVEHLAEETKTLKIKPTNLNA